jgi:hypothetical protein
MSIVIRKFCLITFLLIGSLSVFADSRENKIYNSCARLSNSIITTSAPYVKGDKWCSKLRCSSADSFSTTSAFKETCNPLKPTPKSDKDISERVHSSCSNQGGLTPTPEVYKKDSKLCIKYSCKDTLVKIETCEKSSVVNAGVAEIDRRLYELIKKDSSSSTLEGDLVCNYKTLDGKRIVGCSDGKSYIQIEGTSDSHDRDKTKFDGKKLLYGASKPSNSISVSPVD